MGTSAENTSPKLSAAKTLAETGERYVKARSNLELSLRRFFRHKLAVIGLTVSLILVLSGLLAPVLAPYRYDFSNLMDANKFPSRDLAPKPDYPKLGKAELLRQRLDLAPDFVALHAADTQGKAEILRDSEMRIERIGLEHHGDAAPGGRRGGNVAAIDQHAAGTRVLEPRDDAQQRGLAAAGRADEDDEFAVLHVEVDALQHVDVAERLLHLFDFQRAHCIPLRV